MSVRADRVLDSLPVPAFTASVASPLPEHARAAVGERFWHDFAQIPVHTDARAADRSVPEGEPGAAAHSVMTGGRPRIDHGALAGLVQGQAAATPASRTTRVAPAQTSGPTPGHAPSQAEATKSREQLDPARYNGAMMLAELYRNPYGPAVLTVTLRTHITFAEHPPGREPDKPVELPSAAAQSIWKQKFHDRVGRAWSYKHYLDLDGPAPDEHSRAVVNVRAQETTPSDVKIVVYSWSPYRSNFNRSSETMELVLGDVDENSDGQIVAAHEAGHALGLDHIDGTDNGSAAYGTFNEAADIMGGGPTVSVTDYQVFAAIMEQITHVRWKVTPGIAPPRNPLPLAAGFAVGVFGALVGGLLGGLLGGPLGAFIGAAVTGGILGGGLALLLGEVGAQW